MRINGTVEELKSSHTLDSLLIEKGYDVQRVAIELNGNVIPRAQFSQTTLNEDDILEIVHFVGGG